MPTTNMTDVTIANKDIQSAWFKFLLTETATSAVANTLFSIFFVFLIFHGHARVPVKGVGGLIFDGIPQSFMVGLMGTLISPLISRKRIATGDLGAIVSNRLARVSSVYIRAFLFALSATIVGVALQAILLPLFFPATVSFIHVLIYKSIYGASLAIVITPCALHSAFKKNTDPVR